MKEINLELKIIKGWNNLTKTSKLKRFNIGIL